MGVTKIESEDMFNKLLNESAEGLLVVDFYATWCGPCKALAPFLEQLSTEHPNVVFAKLDVDDVSEVAEKWEISAMPTIIFFKGTKKIGEVIGMKKEEIKKLVEENK